VIACRNLLLTFTPAKAGNTYYVKPRLLRIYVHPRQGGEYTLRQTQIAQDLRSPPPRRGIHTPSNPDCSGFTFTPAKAGNTHYVKPRLLRIYAHPRQGGEYTLRQTQIAQDLRSPPPRRGIHSKSRTGFPGLTLTPSRIHIRHSRIHDAMTIAEKGQIPSPVGLEKIAISPTVRPGKISGTKSGTKNTAPRKQQA